MKTYIVVFLMVGMLMAVPKYIDPGSAVFDIAVHDTNNVELYISNYGMFGANSPGYPGCFWPKGSNHNYIFGAGMWFGTVDSATGDTLVTIGYGPHGGETEFVPGLKGMSVNHPDAIIFMHPENWPAPDSALPMAPQDTVSHEDSWCCMNDCDSTAHIPGDTRPIEIEMYQTGYAWDLPIIEDVVFLCYEIKNVSGHGLYDCYVGVCTDNDIGNEAGIGNDIIAGIVNDTFVIGTDTFWVNDVGYQWQNEIEPTPAPPWWPGAIAFDLLQTPFDLVEGQDKDNDGIPDQYEQDSAYYWDNVPQYLWDSDMDGVYDWRDPSENPQHGMTAFKRFTLSNDPSIDAERYMSLAGYDMNGQYNPYDTTPSQPDDQRFLMSSGPFDMAPDASVHVVFAIMFTAWDSLAGIPTEEVVLVDAAAQYWYDMYWFLYYGIAEHNTAQITPNFTILPNPATNSARVSFANAQPGLVAITLYNSIGQAVKKITGEHLSKGMHTFDLDLRDLAQGMYFVVIKTPDQRMSRSLVISR